LAREGVFIGQQTGKDLKIVKSILGQLLALTYEVPNSAEVNRGTLWKGNVMLWRERG